MPAKEYYTALLYLHYQQSPSDLSPTIKMIYFPAILLDLLTLKPIP